MKAVIDRSGCIGCGLCVDICPKVFHMADDGFAEVVVEKVEETEKDSAKEARDSCPVSVISIEE